MGDDPEKFLSVFKKNYELFYRYVHTAFVATHYVEEWGNLLADERFVNEGVVLKLEGEYDVKQRLIEDLPDAIECHST